MKRIFWSGIMFMVVGLLACGNGGKKEVTQVPTVEQTIKKRGFQFPEIPVMLTDPDQRAIFVANHYWDHFDFRDTVYIHLPDITEQAAVNFMDLLQRIPQEEALSAVRKLAEKASAEPVMLKYFWDTLYRYWHDPNSPMKNEDMFILLCKGMEQTPQVGEYLMARAAYFRKMAEKNRTGMKAADFVYTLASGKQGRLHGIKANYTLVFFYDPDCETCSEIKQMMKASQLLEGMTASGQMKVLTIYPETDIDFWKEHLYEMSDKWINGYDKGQVLTLEQRYDLSSIPSFYLLDKDKKVVLKDADWGQVLHFFENK